MSLHQFQEKMLSIVKADSIASVETIQSLWSDYGSIARVQYNGGAHRSSVVKVINLKPGKNHPRGWNTDRSHLRKLKSYEVERHWYLGLNHNCDRSCQTPGLIGEFKQDDAIVLILDDLHQSGFTEVKRDLDYIEVESCIRWLASFHGTFLGQRPEGLWLQGSYWHLATRPDEWQVMEEGFLKEKARLIDERLQGSSFSTLIHGDAKIANFCFQPSTGKVAAVDFQYVGGGCGMVDLAYFMGSCLSSDQCFDHEVAILDLYFNTLAARLKAKGTSMNQWHLLEADWRGLYPYAWADFQRFLEGWQPGHWKIHGYSQQMVNKVKEDLL